ncbi:MAG: hypothetical protein WB974_08090, partial [Acidobacteriaceae bacterium]
LSVGASQTQIGKMGIAPAAGNLASPSAGNQLEQHLGLYWLPDLACIRRTTHRDKLFPTAHVADDEICA